MEDFIEESQYFDETIYDYETKQPITNPDFSKGWYNTVVEDGKEKRYWYWFDNQKQDEIVKDKLREEREPLFEAFNIYASMLSIHAISVLEVRQQQVLEWYQKLKDITLPNADLSCLEEIPNEVSYYLKQL